MTNAMLICQKPANADQLRLCALFQRRLFELLVTEHNLMWDEILFPCADSRSVTVAEKLNENAVFGTHAIISNADKDIIAAAAEKAAVLTECSIPYKISELKSEPEAIKKALRISAKGFEEYTAAGDFSSVSGGCDENWKIRDNARKFLSFVETAGDRTGKSFVGILGGKAVFEHRADIEIISKIYESKTGTKIKIHKVGRSAE